MLKSDVEGTQQSKIGVCLDGDKVIPGSISLKISGCLVSWEIVCIFPSENRRSC